MDRRVEGAVRVVKHLTSMMQDVESGCEIEIDTIIGSLAEPARLVDKVTRPLSLHFSHSISVFFSSLSFSSESAPCSLLLLLLASS